MEKALEMLGDIDWSIFIQRVLWSLPLCLLVVLACVVVFKMTDKAGRRKIDYVYASTDEKENMREQQRCARKKVIVCVFWITLFLGCSLQYMADFMLLNGGL